jgi:hypothetical protein
VSKGKFLNNKIKISFFVIIAVVQNQDAIVMSFMDEPPKKDIEIFKREITTSIFILVRIVFT